MECKDRNNRSAVMLPYKFLPSMAAENLRDAAEKVFFSKKKELLVAFFCCPLHPYVDFCTLLRIMTQGLTKLQAITSLLLKPSFSAFPYF